MPHVLRIVRAPRTNAFEYLPERHPATNWRPIKPVYNGHYMASYR